MPPKKQFRRVAAWIYAVMNPVIDSLQRELLLFDSGNLTWGARTGRSEVIRTIQEYVDPTQWPNYQDFLAEHAASALIPGFKRHDSSVEELNTVTQKVFNWMVSSEKFLDSFGVALKAYENRRASLGPQAQPLMDVREDFEKEAAQHVINNARFLPSHYVISAFWNSEGKALIAFRNLPEFQPLHRSRESLAERSAKHKQALESYRLSLSRGYDVPAAPVPGASFEE